MSDSFSKRDREKKKRERAEEKRQRRAERAESSDSDPDAPDDEALMERFREISEAYAAGATTQQAFESERREIYAALGIASD
jgi:hypothetical protein